LKEHELRIEVDFNKQITLKLLSGTAEIFGTELLLSKVYTLTGCKVALFSWHGCEIEVKGSFEVAYVSDETPMMLYLNTHLALEWMRYQAEKDHMKGPRVMLCGPTDVGKSSISRILISYAVRQGHYPIFVDLDVGQGALSVPGAMAAVALNRPVDIEEGYSNLEPLTYFYGHTSLNGSPKVFRKHMGQLAKVIQQRCLIDHRSNTAGLVINSCGWVEDLGYELLLHAIEVFDVNVLLVVDHERLYIDLTREFKSKSGMYLAKLPKSGGVVTRSQEYRRKARAKRIRDYFYGVMNDLCPYSLTMNINDASVFKFGEGPVAPSSALPIGADRKVDEAQPVRVIPGGHLLHSLLALSSCEVGMFIRGSSNSSKPLLESANDSTFDLNLLLESNVLGFVYVSDIDEQRGRITLLLPFPGRLPRKHLLLGTIKWIE
jgi:polyribonucleotide 5'-hydroxyl-kinase